MREGSKREATKPEGVRPERREPGPKDAPAIGSTNPQTPLDIELEPCPFCEARQAVDCHDTSGVWVERSDHDDPEYTVVCWSCGAHSKEFPSRDAAIAAWNTRPTLSPLDREAVARIAALHGLGTLDGRERRGPPNERWTQKEWEKRILECVPERVEKHCYALADAILALQPAPAQPLAPSIHTSESLVEALEEIEELDDPDLTETDLLQHSRSAGWAAAMRMCANIARAALTDTGERG